MSWYSVHSCHFALAYRLGYTWEMWLVALSRAKQYPAGGRVLIWLVSVGAGYSGVSIRRVQECCPDLQKGHISKWARVLMDSCVVGQLPHAIQVHGGATMPAWFVVMDGVYRLLFPVALVYVCAPVLLQGIAPQGLQKIQDEELKAFVMMCINHDADERPEARQLLKHPFFDCIRTPTPPPMPVVGDVFKRGKQNAV